MALSQRAGNFALVCLALATPAVVLGLQWLTESNASRWRIDQARLHRAPDPDLGTVFQFAPDGFLERPSNLRRTRLVVAAGSCKSCSTEKVDPLAGIRPELYDSVIVVVQGAKSDVGSWRDRVPEPISLYADETGGLTQGLNPAFVPRTYLLGPDGALLALQREKSDSPNLTVGGPR